MSARRVRGWWMYLVAGAAATAYYLAQPPGAATGDTVFAAIAVSSAIAIFAGIRLHRPAHPRLWYLLGAGAVMNAIAEVLWTVYANVLGDKPYPSPADVFYVGAYPLLAAGIFVLIRGRSSRRDRAGLLDAAIVTSGLTLLAWTFLMRPVALDDSLPGLEQALSLAYPAADVLLLAMLVRLVVTPGARTASYRMLVTALVLMLVSDTAFSVLTVTGAYDGGVVDVGWLAYYVLFGAAALHPSMRTISEVAPDRAPRMTRTRFAVLTSASLLAPAALVAQGLTDRAGIDWLGIATGAVVLFVLVLLRLWHLIGTVQDQASQLAALARNDALTGVPNRRAWDLELPRELARARRSRQPIAVGIIDLDHFKAYNDTHGHQAGDLLLKEAAAAWREELREGDLLARYGGEEFGLLLPATTAEQALAIVERMRARTPRGNTFSAGVAMWVPEETPEQLVNRADTALYTAKRDGRARVALADTAPSLREVTA